MELAVVMLKLEPEFQVTPRPGLSGYKKPNLCPERSVEYLCAPNPPVSGLATQPSLLFGPKQWQ